MTELDLNLVGLFVVAGRDRGMVRGSIPGWGNDTGTRRVPCTKGDQMILNYDDALNAISEGETDWETLTRRVGRNDLPAILVEVARDLTDDQLAAALRDAWVMPEIPEDCLARADWLDLFTEVGYRHNLDRAEPPAEITLWRGGIDPNRMAWTADRQLAEWFRDRAHGKLWTANVPASHLLARYDGVRTGGGSGPGETEYVVNPAGLKPEPASTGG